MIRTFIGPTFSNKSAKLIEIYNSLWNKDIVISFKPKIDTRDGEFIQSKKYKGVKIPAIFISNIAEIKEHVIKGNYKTVFIDEAQFLEGDVRDLVDLSVILDIDFYIAGLNMTSEQEPFEIMANILAVSDEITHINGYCQDCNRPSVYSFSIKEDKVKKIDVGNDYISLCPSCLRARILKKNSSKLLIRSL